MAQKSVAEPFLNANAPSRSWLEQTHAPWCQAWQTSQASQAWRLSLIFTGYFRRSLLGRLQLSCSRSSLSRHAPWTMTTACIHGGLMATPL